MRGLLKTSFLIESENLSINDILFYASCSHVQNLSVHLLETGTYKGKTVPLKIDYVGVAYVISGFANLLEVYSFPLFAVSDMGFRS